MKLGRLESFSTAGSNSGSARNEVCGRARTTNELYLMDAVIEPERLAQISLRQENPRMRRNAWANSWAIKYVANSACILSSCFGVPCPCSESQHFKLAEW